MGLWKLCAALLPVLLLLCAGAHEVSHVKTTGRGPDVTLICPNTTDNMIVQTVCKIQTQRSRGAECLLMYQHEGNFVHGCDSRFTLQTDSEGVVLNLRNLSQEDSGNISCECVHQGGTDTVRLSVTVEEDEEAKAPPPPPPPPPVMLLTVSGVVLFCIVSAAALVFVLRRRKLHRENPRSGASEEEPDDAYTSLQQPASDLYQTIASVQPRHHTEAKRAHGNAQTHRDNQGPDGRETDPDSYIRRSPHSHSTTHSHAYTAPKRCCTSCPELITWTP
ncbi:uncharacterized protein LOC142989161 isoform X3 [Genypterus blacodes]|uniref:uncharacterized protein LOC142989161 isoform X3 n=1 Tax=Genypterus blacodes TaxID=154954 RepID=UPI003F761E8D